MPARLRLPPQIQHSIQNVWKFEKRKNHMANGYDGHCDWDKNKKPECPEIQAEDVFIFKTAFKHIQFFSCQIFHVLVPHDI